VRTERIILDDDMRACYPSFLYKDVIEQALSSLLEKGKIPALPFVKWQIVHEGSSKKLSLLFLTVQRSYITKFVYNLISRFAILGKRVDIPLFFSGEFAFSEAFLQGPDVEKRFTLIEAVLGKGDPQEMETLMQALPSLEEQLRLGALSFFHASRLLEVKGLTLDEKAAVVQERMAKWMQRAPHFYDSDLFEQMQEFFLLSSDGFKACRKTRHLSWMVILFYTFFKRLKEKNEEEPRRRHLYFKCLPAALQTPLGEKRVLALFLGMNFLGERELFEERHFLKAVQLTLPGVLCVKGSEYVSRDREKESQTLYVEVEKESGCGFTQEEMRALQRALPEDALRHIEHLVSPIFMPRNEEEVMRNILILKEQVRFARDLPHVILSFDHQSDQEDLYFTLVMVRPLLPGSLEAFQLFKSDKSSFEFLPERVKWVGMIRNKYPKEASVLKTRVKKSAFLRDDRSLDLYRARQRILNELEGIVGEVRDFNGGMMAKQRENFYTFKKEAGSACGYDDFLLENFFYSLFPIEARTLLSPSLICTLFSLFCSLREKRGLLKNQGQCREEKEGLFALFEIQDKSLQTRVSALVKRLNLSWPLLATLHLKLFDSTYLGYLLITEEKKSRKLFLEALSELDFWSLIGKNSH